MPKTCFIGLGANISNALGSPIDHIHAAIQAFESSADFTDVVVSSLYRSAAYGVTDQPDFYNAVLMAKTQLEPLALLDFCQDLERGAGRVRLRHWGERSLDVDVLLYGDDVINSERLTVPHRELNLRNFVLIPLLQIAPDTTVGGVPLKDLPAAKDQTGIELFSHDAINAQDSFNQDNKNELSSRDQ